MAYIPPHKRNSNDPKRKVLTPDKPPPLVTRNVNVGSSKINHIPAFKIMYADRAISRWWAVGYDETQILSSVNLVPVSVETRDNRDNRTGEMPIFLRNSGLDNGGEVQWDLPKSPWVYMAENVIRDLLESFENVKREMMSSEVEEDVKHTLVARVGKAFLHRPPSVTLESLGENWTTEMLKSWKRRFDTNVPASYTTKIVNEVVPNTGVTFESEKDIYLVKLADSTEPDLILSCKCSVKNGKLELNKVELNQVRNMVVDMSIPDKNLDLRLILAMKKILKSQTDDEMQSITELVDSAITDPGVKDGLRWPLEKKSSGKYYVVGVWHVTSKAYLNQSLRFKVRHADRFDFETSSGEASWETCSLRLKRLESELKEEKVDVSLVSETLEENLTFIWEHFLTCESFLK